MKKLSKPPLARHCAAPVPGAHRPSAAPVPFCVGHLPEAEVGLISPPPQPMKEA